MLPGEFNDRLRDAHAVTTDSWRGRVVLRAVARARASRLARSIDRNPSRGFGAGDLECIRRRPAHQCTVEQDQRPNRAARRKPTLRAGLLRQFRL